MVVNDDFDWEGDRHLRRELSESVIYEMHVRGFTKSRTAKVKCPGTYLGVIEKIPYLKVAGCHGRRADAGQRVPDFGHLRKHDGTSQLLGLRPDGVLLAAPRLRVRQTPGAQVTEFKQMVKALHAAGIEVILDVVFNHTCEGNEQGPTLSFKGLENQVYYILSEGALHQLQRLRKHDQRQPPGCS